MKRIALLSLLLGRLLFSFSQIPVEKYRAEIFALNSDESIEKYWLDLYKTDQDTLLMLPVDNLKAYDSLSTSLMVRTALMFQIHGKKAHIPNNFTPTLNQAHNKIALASLPFWPIINKRIELSAQGELLTEVNLAYELESFSLLFYNYSLLGLQSEYPKLIEKLNQQPKDLIVERLISAYRKQFTLRELKAKQSIGKWYIQPFKNLKEDFCFQILKLSDDNIYIKHGEYFQKLLLLDDGNRMKKYKIENEPFGWYYKLSSDNQLKLYNSNHENLIEYSQCN